MLKAQSDWAYRIYGALLESMKPSAAVLNEPVGFPQPTAYQNVFDFKRDYLLYNYLRKYPGKADQKVLHDKAIRSFFGIEAHNRETNHKLRTCSLDGGVVGVLSDASRKMGRILGDFNYDWVEMCDWGPGATASLEARVATVDKKIEERHLSVTAKALPYAIAFLESDSSWQSARFGVPVEGPVSSLTSDFVVVDASRFTTVEKDYRQRRPIDIQPTFNLFLQKGVGRYIRQRLKLFGIDLNDQSRNQRLAACAHSCGLATIDLSNASDTLARELVRYLLQQHSEQWYDLLDRLRTHETAIDGVPYRLEKFSAMGNGFTFELETLVFFCLVQAVVDRAGLTGPFLRTIAVYGDDIVVHQSVADDVVSVLNACGFIVNEEKSFLKGRFFESCGKHYFDGIDVTPVFQREVIVDLPSAIRAHNRLLRFAISGSGYRWLDDELTTAIDIAEHACRFYLRQVNRARRLRRKPDLVLPLQPWWLEEDGGLISLKPFYADRDGILHLDLLKTSARRVRGLEYALLSLWLRRHDGKLEIPDTDPSYGKVSPRGMTKTSVQRCRVFNLRTDVPLLPSDEGN